MFKKGDRVSWLGLKGTVDEVFEHDFLYPVKVVFDLNDNVLDESFTLEGALYVSQKPSLKLLKKKKKPNHELYITSVKDPYRFAVYTTRRDALTFGVGNSIEVGVRYVRAKDQKRGAK